MNSITASIRELEQQLKALEAAIKTLRGLESAGVSTKPLPGRRNISAAGRRRIIEGQKKRWAKVRAAQKNAAKKTRAKSA